MVFMKGLLLEQPPGLPIHPKYSGANRVNSHTLKSYSEKTSMAKNRPPLFLRTLGVHRPGNRAVRDTTQETCDMTTNDVYHSRNV